MPASNASSYCETPTHIGRHVRVACNWGWRQLNNDPIPPVSPNDALSPIVTYVALGWYAAFRTPRDAGQWERERVLLALVAFGVNVVTI